MFHVSLMATARRFVEFNPAPCAVVWVVKRQIRWFKRNDGFEDLGFFVDVNSMVSDRTLAGSFFDEGHAQAAPEIVMASSWMMEGDFKDQPIKEQCFAMPKYEGVLSLLWAEEEWLDDV
jgi:hypothetical protein